MCNTETPRFLGVCVQLISQKSAGVKKTHQPSDTSDGFTLSLLTNVFIHRKFNDTLTQEERKVVHGFVISPNFGCSLKAQQVPNKGEKVENWKLILYSIKTQFTAATVKSDQLCSPTSPS